MDVIIISYDQKYLKEMAQLFVEIYSDTECPWNIDAAKAYLLTNVKSNPEYCYLAIDRNQTCIGGIFARLEPYYTNTILLIDSLQVKKHYRKKGIGNKLLKKVIDLAKSNRIDRIHLSIEGNKKFPKHWYGKLGFSKTGWVEYEAKVKDIKISE